ncbi:MAG TPA: helix-turn-helix transcriptional regulator [Leptolyngbyaceae cyanobacterium]
MTASSVSSLLQDRQKRLTQLIEQLLKEGWTQSSLANAFGVDFSTVHRWLRGKTIPEFDSKNFRQLARVSGGNAATLQLYLDGEISLLEYRNGFEKKTSELKDNNKKSSSDDIKREILAKIKALEPADIADVISLSAAFLANQG